MKLRATMLMFAAFCFLVTSQAWAAPSICSAVPGNAIQNCGFEDGNFATWTLTGNTGFTGVTDNPIYVNSGTYGAQLGPVGSDGTLSQSFAGNTLMFVYRQDPAWWGLDDVVAVDTGSCGVGCNIWDVSFYLYNDGLTPNDFTVFWNGVDVGPSLVDAPGSPYTLFQGTLKGLSTPEPSSLILMGSGLLGLASVIRRKFSV